MKNQDLIFKIENLKTKSKSYKNIGTKYDFSFFIIINLILSPLISIIFVIIK